MAEVKDPRGIGSPPHTWRIHNADDELATDAGITSTYVENTSSLKRLFHFLQDHLHIRGEYASLGSRLMIVEGSPPHTWRILNDPRYINISQSK